MLPSFDVFGLHIPMFGVMMMCGMLAAFILLWRTRRIIRFSEDTLFSAALWAIVLGFIGSKLLYWIVEFDQVLADPHYLVLTLRRGFVFYGALIGGVIGLIIFSARKKLPFLAFIDLFAPSLVLAQAFGRIGCFCAGCCYGCTTDSCLAVVYPAGSSAPAGVPLLPTQLFESAFLFLLTIALVWLLKKRRPYGTVTGWYLILYGVWRFFIEFYRSDDRGFIGALSTSQFLAIFLIAAGVVLLLLVAKGVLTKRAVPEEGLIFDGEEDEVCAESENESDAEKPDEPEISKEPEEPESPDEPEKSDEDKTDGKD